MARRPFLISFSFSSPDLDESLAKLHGKDERLVSALHRKTISQPYLRGPRPRLLEQRPRYTQLNKRAPTQEKPTEQLAEEPV